MTAMLRRACLALLAVLAGVSVLVTLAAPARARGSARPSGVTLGDWEATGPGGVALSFALARGASGVAATALAIGFPQGCPVGRAHTLAVVVEHPRLVTVPASPPGALLISGTVAARPVNLSGQLISPRSATLMIGTDNPKLPCAWPTTLTWQAHPAHRLAVPDKSWSAAVSGPGLGGTATVQTGAGGRVVTSFQAHYTCTQSTTTKTTTGDAVVGSTPAEEFITPDGRFASPADLQSDHKVAVQWSGAFNAHGALHGSFTDASPCTGQAVHASFAAAAPLPHR